MPIKLLQYTILNEEKYHGEGHIINIAKRHTNRRWRQYTPEKQVLINLELLNQAFIQQIQFKGFGCYITQIVFMKSDRTVLTKLKYNLYFQDENINQKLENAQKAKYVDIKLINSNSNPRRLGLNHFFIKGRYEKDPPKKVGKNSIKSNTNLQSNSVDSSKQGLEPSLKEQQEDKANAQILKRQPQNDLVKLETQVQQEAGTQKKKIKLNPVEECTQQSITTQVQVNPTENIPTSDINASTDRQKDTQQNGNKHQKALSAIKKKIQEMAQLKKAKKLSTKNIVQEQGEERQK